MHEKLEKLEKFIDHTLLKPDATTNDIIKLCNEAKQYGFYAVCVNPYFVKLAKLHLKNSGVLVAATIGFPLGANHTKVKCYEAKRAVSDGADEIDMVINLSAVKDGNFNYVYNEIKKVVNTSKVPVKVILETCKLTEEEIITLCNLAIDAGASFVKTSTGFGEGGATQHYVKLMSKTANNKISVKASGGIKDLKAAQAMISAGANRIGTSSGVKIMKELQEENKNITKLN